MNKKIILILLLALFISAWVWQDDYKRYYKISQVTNIAPPFAKITDIKELKQSFINYLLPYIQQYNQDLLLLRNALLNNTMNTWQQQELATHYKTTPDTLLEHIDIIPPSLALAQAAMESSWGRSRFAQYNNYFGIWCFTPGCGLIPQKRNAADKHEVAIFLTIEDAVSYYVWNLNTHAAYKKLRTLRSQLRWERQKITGLQLIEGLDNYSQIGDNYAQTLQKIIKYNNLTQYD